MGDGDGNDEWKIKVVHSAGPDGGIKTVRTQFKLVHAAMGCTLALTGKKLPKWGFEQVIFRSSYIRVNRDFE